MLPQLRFARLLQLSSGRGDTGDLLVVATGGFHCVSALEDVLSVSRFVPDRDADAQGD
jgi:hypothetical protein